MTIRDVGGLDFAYQPPTSSSKEVIAGSIAGLGQTFIAPNSIDTGPYGSFLTELAANDTQLAGRGEHYQAFAGGSFIQVGQTFYFTESGVGNEMKLVVDWVSAVVGIGGTIQIQLITSASPTMSNPVVMIDFGALPLSAFLAGYRQITPLPRSSNWGRYLGLRVITTGFLSSGSYVAWIGLDVDSEVPGYVEGFQIK
jgi:hypothetical protein